MASTDNLLTVGLAAPVEYRDRDGNRKAAIVIATPESISDNGAYLRPEAGTVHLSVLSPSGSRYVKHNVAPGEGPQTFSVL